jgi:c(7)-type cytochrome triheme protein
MRLLARRRITFWRAVAAAIFLAGLYSTYVRFSGGLGASTALSDRFPWGLWVGFDVLCGVALAAGGFTMSAAVYVLHLERFKPIIRPTILTAFLGYLLVIVALLFDLGRPYNIWHPLVMWNPHSVMFEVAWCVMLYTTVLALEFSPLLWERLGWEKPLKVMHALTVPLVILGVILSFLHQSSLGSLFLIVPHRLHPLWYSPLLPVFFFISALALGCAMTIFESFLSFRAFGKRLERELLTDLAKVIVGVLALYLVLKLQDLAGRGALHLAAEPTYEGRLFLAEMVLGTIAPMVLLLVPRVRTDDFGLFVSAVMVVLGFVMNRLNVSITGMEASSGVAYFPSVTEISVTVMIITLGFVLFGLAVKYLRVFPERVSPRAVVELPAPAVFRRLRQGSTAVVAGVGGAVLILVLVLGTSGVRLRPLASQEAAAPVEADLPQALEHFTVPPDILYRSSEGSPGTVTFSHASHLEWSRPRCSACHPEPYSLLGSRDPSSPRAAPGDMHAERFCGRCHTGERAFDLKQDCAVCHKGP